MRNGWNSKESQTCTRVFFPLLSFFSIEFSNLRNKRSLQYRVISYCINFYKIAINRPRKGVFVLFWGVGGGSSLIRDVSYKGFVSPAHLSILWGVYHILIESHTYAFFFYFLHLSSTIISFSFHLSRPWRLLTSVSFSIQSFSFPILNSPKFYDWKSF